MYCVGTTYSIFFKSDDSSLASFLSDTYLIFISHVIITIEECTKGVILKLFGSKAQSNIFHEELENVFHSILGFDFTRENAFYNTPIMSIILLTSWLSGNTAKLRRQILLSVLSSMNLSLVCKPWVLLRSFSWTWIAGKDLIHFSLSTSPSSECKPSWFSAFIENHKNLTHLKILLTSSKSFLIPLVNWVLVDPFSTFWISL